MTQEFRNDFLFNDIDGILSYHQALTRFVYGLSFGGANIVPVSITFSECPTNIH